MFPLCMQYVTDLLAYNFPQQKVYGPRGRKATEYHQFTSLSMSEGQHLYGYSVLPQEMSCLTTTTTTVSLQDNTTDFLCSFKVWGRKLTKNETVQGK